MDRLVSLNDRLQMLEVRAKRLVAIINDSINLFLATLLILTKAGH